MKRQPPDEAWNAVEASEEMNGSESAIPEKELRL